MNETKGLKILGVDRVDPQRRNFMRTAAEGAALAAMSGCNMDDFFRRHFRELSKSDVDGVLRRIEQRNLERFGRTTTVGATGARPGVEFGYGLDLSRCVGCRRWGYACVQENNQSREHPQIHWIRVLQMDKEHGVDLTHADVYYEPDHVPQPGKFYFPVQCQHCVVGRRQPIIPNLGETRDRKGSGAR